eukprot:403341386
MKNETETPLDFFYVLSTNNEAESNLTLNPYFGEITLMRSTQRPYLRLKESNQQSQHLNARKASKQLKEEKYLEQLQSKSSGSFQGSSYQNENNQGGRQSFVQSDSKQLITCFQHYVPGVIVHMSFNQYIKDQFLVVYRIVSDTGALHRVRVYSNIKCNDDKLLQNYNTFQEQKSIQGQIELQRAIDEEEYFIKNTNKIIFDDMFEDFALNGNFQVTAFSFIRKDTIVYSRYLDNFQFRLLKREVDYYTGEITWIETQRGPILDRKQAEKIFICTGIHYIETGPKNSPNLVIVAIRGSTATDVKITVEIQHQIQNRPSSDIKDPAWQTKTQIYEKPFQIFQAPNIYNNELTNYLTMFSDAHPKNQIIGIFGQNFLALDWDPKTQNILVFETFKEHLQDKIDLLTVVPDNSNFFLYSHDSHTLYQVYREKGESEKVWEEWIDNKKILAQYVKYATGNTKERVLMLLFEGGVFASFKIEELSEDIISTLEMIDNDAFIDFFVPLIVAIVAAGALYIKRRRQSQRQQPVIRPRQGWGGLRQNANGFNQQDIIGGIPFNQFQNMQQQNQQQQQNNQPPAHVPPPVRIENLNPLDGDILDPAAEEALDQNINNLNRIIDQLENDLDILREENQIQPNNNQDNFNEQNLEQ